MKDITHFLSNPQIFHYFTANNESDLNIFMFGYHDFHIVEAEKTERQQFFHTLHYVISGKGYLCINGNKFPVHQNQVFYLDNKSTFSYFPDEKEPWEYVFFELTGNFMTKFAKTANFSATEPVKTCTNQQSILYLIKENLRENSIPSTYLAKSLLYLILDSVTNKQTVHYSQGERIIREAKELIELKYYDPTLDLDNICKAVHVSHSHFCRIFKKSQGITPIQHINNVRLNHAKDFLKQTNLSVYEIAFKVGYREYEHFLRLFKKVVKVTPTEYRKKAIN